MKSLKKIMLLVLLLNFGFAQSQNFTETFEKANELYQQGRYQQAMDTYRQIIDAGFESTALYFNMGNVYYKMNDLAMAILYYERAARLSPYDDDIRQNLEIANQATIDRFEEMPKPLVQVAYLSILKALSPGGWAMAAVVLLLAFLAGTYMCFFTAARRRGFMLGIFGLLFGIISLSLAYAHQNHLQNNRPAIITATSSYVKSGPGEKAEDVFILHEGAKVVVTEHFDAWKKIRLPDGKVGWIDTGDLVEI